MMMMSSADLLEDGFPHGTPEGYDQGCRSAGGCPTGREYGLSCKIAKTKSRSDYQYAKLVKAGASVAEIAYALGLIGTAPTAAPVAKKKPAKPEHDAWSTPSITTTVPVPVIAATTITPDAAVPAPASVRPETPTKLIRAWARDRGYDVPGRGTLRQEIIEHYWEAHGHGATTPADQAPVNKPEPQEDAAEAPIDPVDEAQDQPPVNEPQREDRPDYGTMNLENDLAEAIAQRDQARAFAATYWDELERTKQLLNTERERHAASVHRADATIDHLRAALGTVEKAFELVLQKWGEATQHATITDDMEDRAAAVVAEVTGEPRVGRFERTVARAILVAALTDDGSER